MAYIEIGGKAAMNVPDGGTFGVTSNGGFVTVVATPRNAASATYNLGPSTGVLRLGPFPEGAAAVVTNLSAPTVDVDFSAGGSGVVTCGTSRNLLANDDGWVIECTATVTLTQPAGMPGSYGVGVIPSGTTSIASSGGALLNGATTTLTRAAASNAIFAIQARASAADSYVVTGS